MATYSYIDQTADAAVIPKIWGNLALGYLAQYLNLGRTVAKDTDFTSAAQYGDVIHVSKRGALSANAITDNNGVTVQKPTRTDITVSLDQHYEVTFGQLDIVKALSRGMSEEQYAADAALVLAEKIESSIAGLHPQITNTVTGTADAEADLLTIRERFVNNKVPKDEQKFGFVTPSQMTKFLKVDRATNAYIVGSAFQNPTIAPNAPMQLHGFSIFESQAVLATGSPVAWHNLFYTRNAFVLAMRAMPLPEAGTGAIGAIMQDDNGFVMRVIKSFNSLALGTQITTDVLYGTAVLDSRLAVEFETF